MRQGKAHQPAEASDLRTNVALARKLLVAQSGGKATPEGFQTQSDVCYFI